MDERRVRRLSPEEQAAISKAIDAIKLPPIQLRLPDPEGLSKFKEFLDRHTALVGRLAAAAQEKRPDSN